MRKHWACLGLAARPLMMLMTLLLVATSAAAAQTTAAAQDPRPTVAVMTFTGGAMGRGQDYAAFGRGVREILATALASNLSIRVVERDRLQAVLDEQHLSASAVVDPETAVQLGRVLGANHFITGGFLIDTKDHARLDVRSVNVETSEIEYRKTVEGSTSKLLELLDRLARDVNDGLHLPAARNAFAGVSPGKGDQTRATLLLGRAIEALTHADSATARNAATEALSAVPQFPAARALLQALDHRP